MKTSIWLFFVLVSASPQAKNFGRQGALFPIAEVDMLAWIDQRLHHLEATGQTAQMQQGFTHQVEQSVRSPPPVKGLTTTTEPRVFYIDPSLTLGKDIVDANGAVLYHKGLVINPFDSSTWPAGIPKHPFEYSYVMVFFDGDDPNQRAFAKQFHADKPIKWILTNGRPEELAETLDARTYFDQQGHYSRQFQLRHIPAVIEQDGTRWKVTELDASVFTPTKEAPIQ